jgi:hypothetical protein
MKKFFLLTAVSFLFITLSAQTSGDKVIKFPDLVHDFGKIKQGVPATFDFEFTNISGKPVVIENASASCGCTTPKWPQAPVMAGKKEKINVGYNAASVGAFSKTITVKVAGVEAPVTLTINGEVLTAEAYDTYIKEKGKSSKSGK